MSERILIVDDHPLTRDALAALLTQQGFDVVGEAEDGKEAIAVTRTLQPDLVLLDLTMPGMDGLTALPKIREQAPDCEVVVLTASDTEENLLGAIRAGAAGYLLKTEPPEQIASFLRGVARGDAALSGGVARRLLDRVREGGRFDGIPDSITQGALGPRGRGAAASRRAPRDGRDRAAAVHLRAHRALAREEPAEEARRLLASRSARAARDGARRASGAYAASKPSRAASTSDGQRREVVAAFERDGHARRERGARRASSRKPSAVTQHLREWVVDVRVETRRTRAGDPARSARTAGSTTSPKAATYSASPEPAESGTFTVCSSLVPGPPVPG